MLLLIVVYCHFHKMAAWVGLPGEVLFSAPILTTIAHARANGSGLICFVSIPVFFVAYISSWFLPIAGVATTGLHMLGIYVGAIWTSRIRTACWVAFFAVIMFQGYLSGSLPLFLPANFFDPRVCACTPPPRVSIRAWRLLETVECSYWRGWNVVRDCPRFSEL